MYFFAKTVGILYLLCIKIATCINVILSSASIPYHNQDQLTMVINVVILVARWITMAKGMVILLACSSFPLNCGSTQADLLITNLYVSQ